MLEGPARIWLNNLPENIIECSIDFEKAFVSNFTSTYKRPNRPQQLAACRQRENETDREYLTRWSQMRNQGSSDLLVRSGMQAWQHVVAEAAEGDANHLGRNHQDCRYVCSG